MNKIFKKSNSNNLEKIILNKKSDLINIPIQQLRTAQLKNFSGSLFEQIYKEAILIEKNQANKIKKQLLESKEHSNFFWHFGCKRSINKNIDDYYNVEKIVDTIVFVRVATYLCPNKRFAKCYFG